MVDEEDGDGAVTDNARAWASMGVVAIGAVLAFAAGFTTRPDPTRRAVPSAPAQPVREPDTEWQTTRQKWGAEADALDMILRERQEPQGGITCYRRAGRYECPLHLAGQPTRWAACRLRREDERNDDGGRCAWIVR